MGQWAPPRPVPSFHAQWIYQTIALNNQLNREAQAKIDAKEPMHNIWEDDTLAASMSGLTLTERLEA